MSVSYNSRDCPFARKRIQLATAAFVVVSFFAAGLLAERGSPPSITTQQAPSPLKFTDLMAHGSGQIRPGRNYIYGPALQLAWNRLLERTKGPIHVDGDPQLVEQLNRQLLHLNELSDNSYVAVAGTQRDGVTDRVRAQMDSKFPGRPCPLLMPQDPNELVLFAYLFKRLTFKYDFDRLDDPVAFHSHNGVHKVRCFGIEKMEHLESVSHQVRVWDYKSEDDFIIELKTKSSTDHLILATVERQSTLDGTLRFVQERIDAKEKPGLLRKGDSLRIPILDVRAETLESKLTGKRILNGPFQKTIIGSVQVLLHFRLDEQGAGLQTFLATGYDEDKPKPRHFVFNKPFLVYLRETKARNPYFAIWVENEEVMELAKTNAG